MTAVNNSTKKSSRCYLRPVLKAAIATQLPIVIDAKPHTKPLGVDPFPFVTALCNGSLSKSFTVQGSLMAGTYPCSGSSQVTMAPGRRSICCNFTPSSKTKAAIYPSPITVIDPVLAVAAENACKHFWRTDCKQDELTGQDNETAYPHFWLYAGPRQLSLLCSKENGKAATLLFYNGSHYPHTGAVELREDESGRMVWTFGDDKKVAKVITEDAGGHPTTMASKVGMRPHRVDSDEFSAGEDFDAYKGLPSKARSKVHVSRRYWGNGPHNLHSIFAFKTDLIKPYHTSYEIGRTESSLALEFVGAVYDLLWMKSAFVNDPADQTTRLSIDYAAYLQSIYNKVQTQLAVRHKFRAPSKEGNFVICPLDPGAKFGSDDEFKRLCGDTESLLGLDYPLWDVDGMPSTFDRYKAEQQNYSVMSQRAYQSDQNSARDWLATRAMLPLGYHVSGDKASLKYEEEAIHLRAQKVANPILRHAYSMMALVANNSSVVSAIDYVKRATSPADTDWTYHYLDNGPDQSSLLSSMVIGLALTASLHSDKVRIYGEHTQQGEGGGSAVRDYYDWYAGFDDDVSWLADIHRCGVRGGTGLLPLHSYVPLSQGQRTSPVMSKAWYTPIGMKATRATGSTVPVDALLATQCDLNADGPITLEGRGSFIELLMPWGLLAADATVLAVGAEAEVRTWTQVFCPAAEPAAYDFDAEKARASETYYAGDLDTTPTIGPKRDCVGSSGHGRAFSPYYDDCSVAIALLGDSSDSVFSISHGFSTHNETAFKLDSWKEKAITPASKAAQSPEVFAMKKLSIKGDGPIGDSPEQCVPLWSPGGYFKYFVAF